MIGETLTFKVEWKESGDNKTDYVTIPIGIADVTPGPGVTDDPYNPYPTPPIGGTTPITVTAELHVSKVQASPGEIITLKYTIKNLGMFPITGLSITDKDIGGKDPMVKGITVDAGGSFVHEQTYRMGNASVTSAAVVSYVGSDGVTQKFEMQEKQLGMTTTRITVNVEQGPPSADGQRFTLTLINNGNQRITKIKVTDELGVVLDDGFQLAIGESVTLSHTVPTNEPRNVLFNITGVDARNQTYTDKTNTFTVRKYIDPALIGIQFSANVTETLNAAGSITVEFIVENTGSLEMHDLTLVESETVLYQLADFGRGTERIVQKVNVGEPRLLVFTLSIADPAGNIYEYRANITASHIIGPTELAPTPAPTITIDTPIGVGDTIRDSLRVALIMLTILTVIAGILLILLAVAERKERKRIAARRAQKEKLRREQAMMGN